MTYLYEIVCPFCGATHYVRAREEGIALWQSGERIQNALPELTATEREQLISGLCPSCQSEFFED